jgi:hypothetical protein
MSDLSTPEAREELAALLFDHSDDRDGYCSCMWAADMHADVSSQAQVAGHIADAILAAGYAKLSVAAVVAEKDAEIERLGELVGTQVEQCERHCRAAEAERARAWDEGYLVGDPHQRRGDPAEALNPYRADALIEGAES